MPVGYELEPETGLLVARASGTFDDAEFAAAYGRIVEASEGAAHHSNHLFLMDESAALHNVDMAALLRIKSAIDRWSETYPGRNVRTAFVLAGGPGQYLTVLMWKSLSELYRSIGADVKLFADEPSARAWLAERRTAVPAPQRG